MSAFVRSEPRMIIDEVQRNSAVDRQRPALRGQFVLSGLANDPARATGHGKCRKPGQFL